MSSLFLLFGRGCFFAFREAADFGVLGLVAQMFSSEMFYWFLVLWRWFKFQSHWFRGRCSSGIRYRCFFLALTGILALIFLTDSVAPFPVTNTHLLPALVFCPNTAVLVVYLLYYSTFLFVRQSLFCFHCWISYLHQKAVEPIWTNYKL